MRLHVFMKHFHISTNINCQINYFVLNIKKIPTLLQTLPPAKTIKSTEKLMYAESLNLLPLSALPLFSFP